ncbi:MAG: uroporphyrinogen-III C-methyltransferase [Verrucomicrobiae bacterium]|nr:uroporphyrinogen-III C-methyltransferase [Verrucomicrobiae bacterium]MCP5539959.1 uroporphyrinogen-III C-methyltransferase [Akkermansiaceae bacterium]MCP5549892.1 uroporphyrinogen-III C-methyltransferase [Akkermansiaceae bacterium]
MADSPPSQSQAGICYLVGAGPGDPGLMTLRGRECLERADVVVYDYLSNPDFLKWARPDAEKIYAGKKSRDHTLTQDQINALIVEKTRAGHVVTRLKGGDPLIFGRGGEEAAELRAAGVRFEIVPGISSSIAGPAYAGIPVTHRAHNAQLTIFTGHEDPAKAESSIDYEQIARAPGTKVMLMGVERLGTICESLAAHGMAADTPVALVRWATTGRQGTLTGQLDTIARLAEEREFKAPAVAVFGGVVGLRETLNWFETRPLFGKRVVVTRTRSQAGELSRQLRDLGADVLEMPTIRVEGMRGEKLREFAELVRDAHTYEWLVFTSPNGVDHFFEVFFKLYDDIRSIGGARIAAIGPGTAAKLKERGLGVDLTPEVSVAESLADAFEKEAGSLDNITLLWVRAEGARSVLSERLNRAGAILDEAIAYRTVPETDDPTGAVERFRTEGADIVTFTSSSTVECFLDLGLEMPAGTRIASIGPITSDTLRQRGLSVDIEAENHDIPGLVKAVSDLASQG